MSIKCVDELGSLIEARWQVADHDAAHFPEITAKALQDVALPEQISADEILEWGLRSLSLPHQRDPNAEFGKPPLTLYNGRRFHIDALFWVDGTTTIHQHAFSGAFQVLAGSSIETRYEFDVERTFDGHFVTGTLRLSDTVLRGRGDIAPIHSGPRGVIHALFHLERPSVTIVIRNAHDANSGPQFTYVAPGLGYDPHFVDETRDRVLQLVSLLRHTEHPKLEKWVGDLVARSDPHTAYRVLDACVTLPDRALFDRLVDRVRDRTFVDCFRRACEEKRRLSFLVRRRANVQDPDLRFFLGVLLNAHRRQDAISLVAARVADCDPARQIASWVRQLSGVNAKVQVGGVPWEPNLLGLPEFSDESETELAQVLRGEDNVDNRFASLLEKLRANPSLACLFS